MEVTFGTDGVRGVANVDITPELALALGRASVRVFGVTRVYVGRDTRASGAGLEAAVVAGVCAEGAKVVAMGVVPTPAVAHATLAHTTLTRSEARQGNADNVPGAAAGIVISASHNPYGDNGLKVFAPGGRKLTDDEQHTLVDVLESLLNGERHTGPSGTTIGTPVEDPEAVPAYISSILAPLEGRTLSGVKVVVDAANGANSQFGPDALVQAGADVVAIHTTPNGVNINAGCGSTHPESLQAAVAEHGADLGLAFDGDADRLLAVDETGQLVDGDQLLGLFAVDMAARGILHHDTVVVTVMSNLGFRQAMTEAGINVVDTAVGDRYVLEALGEGGYSLGGEQSGHIIFRDLSTTGDGLLAAVMLCDLVNRSDGPFSALASGVMTRLPQVLVNVRLAHKVPDVADRLSAEISRLQSELGDTGRILLRPSGTEPVIRVMVEAPTADQAQIVADSLAADVAALDPKTPNLG